MSLGLSFGLGMGADRTFLSAGTDADLSWNSSTDTYSRTNGANVTTVHLGMRRCLLNVDGTVNYYLDANDSTKKADGTSADLTGADGQVMVQIPKFYYKYAKTGDVHKWEISARAKTGFTLHPAFVKAGVEVDYRYYSAYDAVWYDATTGTYKSPENSSDLTASLDLSNDFIGSVSGEYPIVGVTIAEYRTLSSNIGTGWHQLDYYLMSAVQLLYLVEYGDFDSQAMIGVGNTRHTSWPTTAGNANTRTCKSGASNSIGNASGGVATGTINIANNGDFMSYRGIENFFGNAWNLADGVFISPSGELGAYYVTNDYRDFSDNTTDKTKIGTATTAGENYATQISSTSGPVFIPTSISGGSATTYLADFYSSNTSVSRVLLFGGTATFVQTAGAFNLYTILDASFANRATGARLCY